MWLETINVWLPLALIILGFFVGRGIERRHYDDIHRREKAAIAVPIVTSKTLDDDRAVATAQLATGAVVISIDYYKRFAMGLRSLIGGEAHGYSALIDRARREAVLRMRESATDADLFLNFRIQTATLHSGRAQAPGSVEVIAYATAIRFNAA